MEKESSQLPIQEETASISCIAVQRRVDHEVVMPLDLHEPTPRFYSHQIDIKTQQVMYDRHFYKHETLASPELESQLPSFPPHRTSESFVSIMDDTRRHNPRLHLVIIRNAITLLLNTEKQHLFFPLDHCTISPNGYSIVPPQEPIYYDCPSYTNLIKKSNISFILMSIRQVLPFVQCSHLIKQTLEDICDKWSGITSTANYNLILSQIDMALEKF